MNTLIILDLILYKMRRILGMDFISYEWLNHIALRTYHAKQYTQKKHPPYELLITCNPLKL